MDIPAESFIPYTPDFQCMLHDLSPFGTDRLEGNALVRIMGDLLGAFGRTDFQERVERALRTLNELLNAPGFARYLEILFRYVLQVFDIPKEELGQMVIGTIKRDAEEFLMTTYEQIKQEGRQEGRQEGASRVLIRLLSKKFPGESAHLAALLSRLDPEQQDELSERILEARTIEEIREWLQSVCHN